MNQVTTQEPEEMTKLWGLTSIARCLGVSIDTARRLARKPSVPIYQPAGSGKHFAFAEEILDWMRSTTGDSNGG